MNGVLYSTKYRTNLIKKDYFSIFKNVGITHKFILFQGSLTVIKTSWLKVIERSAVSAIQKEIRACFETP